MEAKVSQGKVRDEFVLNIKTDDGDFQFPLKDVGDGEYAIIGGALAINGLDIDSVRVVDDNVTFYCEDVAIGEIDEESIEAEPPDDD